MSNAVSDALRRVVAHLDGLRVSWALVVDRGYHRGRDLVRLADDYLADG